MLFAAAAACFAVVMGGAPTEAAAASGKKTHAYVPAKKRAKAASSSKASKSENAISVAQRHLMNLGYYGGKIDGKMGKQTVAAIKSFQRDHDLKADGKLGPKTRRALEKADVPAIKDSLTYGTSQPAITNTDVHPDYAASLNGGTKVVTNRFARVDVSETGSGYAKRYAVTLNGQSILTADGQPSVVGVSPTYDMGNEDAIIFTTYSPSPTNCMYRKIGRASCRERVS
jgi:peptidoglycan hydrolase-like protein with peptidoglycan-binding domain